MRVKKRKKSGRHAGTQTHKRGAKERTRGSGNQGGKGHAGTGKRADQKKTLVIKMTGGNNYFGRTKTLRRGQPKVKLKPINLSEIEQKIVSGKLKDPINLKGYKILASGELKSKLKITASAASKQALEKAKKSGAEITLPDKE